MSQTLLIVISFIAHDADLHEAAGRDAVAKVAHADHEDSDIQRNDPYHEKV